MTTTDDRASLSNEAARLQSEGGSDAHHSLVHFRLFEYPMLDLPRPAALLDPTASESCDGIITGS
jgi:hypothetical protein